MLHNCLSLIRSAVIMVLVGGVLASITVPAVQAQERNPDVVYGSSKSQKAANNSEVIDALGLESDQVVSLNFGGSDDAGYTTFTESVSGFPIDFVSLSTGAASVGLDSDNSGSTSGLLSGPSGPGGATDMTRMELKLNVPDGASEVRFDWKFLSEEFPEFVGSSFNDGFVVEVENSTFTVNGSTLEAPGNVAFDSNGDPITINTTGELGMTSSGGSETTYDGGTDILTTTIPLSSEQDEVTLIFSIFDVGDRVYDSSIFLNNVRFNKPKKLELVSLEVNQSIQNWYNSVPLIENKEAIVRAHLQSQNSESVEGPLNVRLKAYRNGEALEDPGGRESIGARDFVSFDAPPQINLDPLEPADADVIRERRRKLDKSLNFALPQDWLHGDVRFELAYPDGSLDCSRAASTDSGCQTDVLSFENSGVLEVVLHPMTYPDNGSTQQPGSYDVQEITQRLESMFPVEGVDISEGNSIYVESLTGKTPNTATDFVEDIDDVSGGGKLHVGIAKELPSSTKGEAETVSIGIIGDEADAAVVANKLDVKSVVAHEIGHLLGRKHATKGGDIAPSGPCGSRSWTESGFSFFGTPPGVNTEQALLGKIFFSDNRSFFEDVSRKMYGYSTGRDKVVTHQGFDDFNSLGSTPPPNTELMSYCNSPRWTSSFTYAGSKEGGFDGGLLNAIQDRFPSPSTSSSSVSSGFLASSAPNQDAQSKSNSSSETYLLVRGRLSASSLELQQERPVAQDGSVEFSPLTTRSLASSEAESMTTSSGTLTLEALSESGEVLQETTFTPSFSVPFDSTATFTVPVLKSTEIQKMQVRSNETGEVWGTATASSNVPSVTVEAPSDGATLNGDAALIQWSGEDSDPDTLSYDIEYSTDGGETWKLLQPTFYGTSLEIDPTTLTQTSQGKIRVQVSDGFNTSTDVSDGTFSVPNSKPKAFVSSPTDGAQIDTAAVVSLRGGARDTEDGQLAGSDLQWNSDVDGSLGTGRTIDLAGTKLSEGDHTITLEATDSDGATDLASVSVEINQPAPQTAPAPPACSELDLSEIALQISDFDASQEGEDTGEFVELTNVGTDPIALSGCSVAFFDGADSESYMAANLSGTADAGGTFTLGNPTVDGVDQVFSEGMLQDGPDAMALYKAPASDFPDGTPAGENLDKRKSAVVYVSDDNIFGCFNASVPGCNSKSVTAAGDPPLLRLEEMVNSMEEETPEEVVLEQNYPNPFNEQTTLRYALPEQTDVKVVLYDLLGRRVRQLAAGQKEAGWHRVTLRAENLAAGTYFVRLTARDQTMTRSVRLVR